MLDWTWITTTTTAAVMAMLSATGIYLGIILYTRLGGLRSFSKMSSFDFAITVAFGSIIAATVLSEDPPLLQALVALGSLYALQFGLAAARQRFRRVSHLVDNQPLLLMDGATMLHENMRAARVTEDDLWAKLREANVLHLGQVRAVVMETTGDISVLHGDENAPALNDMLLTGVRRGAA
ncbi:DUF421 domain-containing protein [Rhodothermaceae bacterium RA]|nr:DUF421 domain-containing protein [Rhodothermaceae bacterium RA]